jgi:hypothetical protein
MPEVTVACRLPHGLKLRLFDMVESQEPVMGGGFRKVKIARDTGKSVTINGWAHPQNAAPRMQLVEGFALTPGIDKEFWDAWVIQNKEHDAVKNHLIFAHEKETSTAAEAKEKKSVRSGLERLDPKNLPRGIQKSDLASTV